MRFRLYDRRKKGLEFFSSISRRSFRSLLSRITARAECRSTRVRQVTKVTPVQSILRHIEPHLFARSNLQNIPSDHLSPPPPSHPLFCHSSVTAKSSVNTKRATRTYVTWGCYPRQKTSRSLVSLPYREHDWDCYPSSDS